MCVSTNNEGGLLSAPHRPVFGVAGVRVLAVLVGVVVSPYHVFISLVTYDGEDLFRCLFAICVFSLVRFLLRSLAHFDLHCFFSYCSVLRAL